MKTSALLLTIVSALSIQTAFAALPAEASGTPAPDQKMKAIAKISGLEADKVYNELPPVLVELAALPQQAAVWVEVERADTTPSSAVTVESRFFLRRDLRGVLSVPGLHRACQADGSWTMKVLASHRETTSTLASVTFHKRAGAFGGKRLAKPTL